MSDPKNKKVVVADEFFLKDADGNVSARLRTMAGEGPILMLYGGGVPRLVLAVGRDGPAVMLADEAGKPVASLSCCEDSTMLQLHTARGKASVAIGAMHAEPGLMFTDPGGKLALVVSVSNGALHVSTREAGAEPSMPLASKLIQ